MRVNMDLRVNYSGIIQLQTEAAFVLLVHNKSILISHTVPTYRACYHPVITHAVKLRIIPKL